MRLDNPSISGSITYLGGGTNTIQGTDASLTGSFTGSFDGDGSGLTGIISSSHAVTASYALTASHSENLIISGNISNVDYIDFITTIETEPQEGRLAWNLDEGTLDIGLENGSVLQIGQEQHWHVRNNTTSSILNGQAVMATGALGASSRITVAPMIADGSIPAKYFLGVATQEIAADSDGYVTTFGKVRDYDTSLIPSGSILWCDPSTPGGLTTTEPTAPNLKLPVAFTLDAKNNGNIAVRATTGVRLENSHDVQVDSATDGDLLVRSGSIWYNSHSLTGSYDLTGSLIVTDEIVAQTLHVQQVTSSIVYSSGSNIFGNQLSDTHQFTGSVSITGSSTFTNHGPAYFLQGRIGIGGETITDSHLLNIQGSSATDNVGVVLNKTNSTAQVWGITNTGPLTIYNYTDSSEALRIDASNNVGIGTNSPSSFGKLTVNDNSTNSRIISRNNYNSGLHYFTAQAFATDTNGGRVSIGSNALVQTAYSDAITRLDATRGAWSWVFQTQNSTYTSQDKTSLQYMTAGGTQSERMTIDSNGDVGINVDNPIRKLHIQGDSISSDTPTVRISSTDSSGTNKFGIEFYSTNGADVRGKILADNNGRVYIDDNGGGGVVFQTNGGSGNVGIGNTSPSYNVHIASSGANYLGISNQGSASGDRQLRFGFAAGDSIARIQGTRLNVADDVDIVLQGGGGDVGIGATPTKKLDVNGFIRSRSGFNLSDGTTQIGGIFKHKDITGAGTDNSGVLFAETGLDLHFMTGGSVTTKMFISGSGNVGLNLTDPTQKLSIRGNQVFTNPSADGVTNALIAEISSQARGYSNQGSNMASIQFRTNPSVWYKGEIAFLTNGTDGTDPNVSATERMRITSVGYLKASNYGTYFNSSDTYHEFISNNNNWTILTGNTNANPFGILVEYTTNANGSSNFPFYFNVVGVGKRIAFRSDGGLENIQANDVNLSDERVKKDIAPLTSYWDKFKALEVVTFKYKDQTHDDDNIGFIAQQVEQVAPEFISNEGWQQDAFDNEEEPLKAIYTADMYNASIKVLQEAMLKIEALEAEIQALKNK